MSYVQFLIDCNKEMFEPIADDGSEDETIDAYSRFDVCLGTIESILLKKLRQNNSNEMVKLKVHLPPISNHFHSSTQLSFTTPKKLTHNQELSLQITRQFCFRFKLLMSTWFE